MALRQPLHALSVYSAVLVANPAAEALPEVAGNIDRLVRNADVLYDAVSRALPSAAQPPD